MDIKKVALHLNDIKTVLNCLFCDHSKERSLWSGVYDYNKQIQIEFCQPKFFFWALLSIYKKKWWLVVSCNCNWNQEGRHEQARRYP